MQPGGLRDGFVALRQRDFRLYFVGQLTSAIGTGMTSVALAFAVLASHRSTSDLGYVLAAQTGPLALFLLVGGVVGDRLGKRMVMLGADTLRGTAQAVLGGWVLLGNPPLSAFILLSALVGTGTAFFVPSIVGMIPATVPTEHLSQANAFNGLTSSVGGMVGPAIAGVIVAAASPGWALTADAITYFVSVASLALLRARPVPGAAGESFLAQLRVGWGEFWSRRWLWVVVLQWTFGNTLVFGAFFVLGAVVSKQSLGGATAWGTILAAQGVGAILGGVFMLRFKPARPLLVVTAFSVIFAWPLLALAFQSPVWLIAVGAGLGGVELALFAVAWDTTVQRQVPPEVIARVSAYDWFGSLVFLPLGFAIVGPVSSAVGIRATLLVGVAYVIVSSLLVLSVSAVRDMRWTEPVREVATP